MKPETQDIVVEAVKAAPGLAMTGITLDKAVAAVTLCFLVLQVAYLLRKWWREETEWGRRLKRWAGRGGRVTQPAELDE